MTYSIYYNGREVGFPRIFERDPNEPLFGGSKRNSPAINIKAINGFHCYTANFPQLFGSNPNEPLFGGDKGEVLRFSQKDVPIPDGYIHVPWTWPTKVVRFEDCKITNVITESFHKITTILGSYLKNFLEIPGRIYEYTSNIRKC